MSGFSMCLIILDIWQGFEYASGIKYAKVLNMLQYSSYSSITVVVSNFIISLVCSICTPRRSATNHYIFFNTSHVQFIFGSY